MPTYAEIMKRVNANPELLRVNTKYSPKMTRDERCAVLAAYMAGFQKPLLAAAFGINRATVSYIVRKESPHYKDIRKEANELGRERFIETYLTDIVSERIEESRSAAQVVMTDDELRERKSTDITSPNPRATSRAGRHAVLYHSGTIHVEVKWYDEVGPDPFSMPPEREAGWYVWADPSSPAWDEGGWEHATNPCTPNTARFTSKTAFDHFLAMVDGEVIE